MNDRDSINSALKRIVIPELRKQGFKGSLPHFRRITDHVDLLSFQFNKYGGGFVVEVAKGDCDDFTTYWGKYIPANKLSAWDLHPDNRTRLKPNQGSGIDCWFRYDTQKDFDSLAELSLEIINKYKW
ncbi:DUF4304 domain-containing protein [Pontiellaceae bacterium B1224]|nr:DUF4304 domain-containing protein [Pontiellaceae bacterium B1224]